MATTAWFGWWVTPDGTCTPFITLEAPRYPTEIVFTIDGKTILLGAYEGGLLDLAPKSGAGAILRVSPDGAIADEPLVTGLDMPGAMRCAPEGFGAYGGQLFVAEIGDWHLPVPMPQNVKSDGRVYRVMPKGELKDNPCKNTLVSHKSAVANPSVNQA